MAQRVHCVIESQLTSFLITYWYGLSSEGTFDPPSFQCWSQYQKRTSLNSFHLNLFPRHFEVTVVEYNVCIICLLLNVVLRCVGIAKRLLPAVSSMGA